MLALIDKNGIPRECCVICKRVLKAADFKPFCSKRCADVDLGRWLKGSYAIPTHERPSDITEDEF
ncbi:MAG: DNA gyrase inhibitor YacG [Litorimonas sp.]